MHDKRALEARASEFRFPRDTIESFQLFGANVESHIDAARVTQIRPCSTRPNLDLFLPRDLSISFLEFSTEYINDEDNLRSPVVDRVRSGRLRMCKSRQDGL